MRETFLERYLAANLGRYDGAVFFFCHQNDDGRRALLVRAAQAAERRIVDVRELDARFAELAASCGQFAFFVSFSMLDELEHYLNTCPQGVRHLLVCSRYGGKRIIPLPFWDFFEERGAEAWDIDAPSFFRDRSWWLVRINVNGLDRHPNTSRDMKLHDIARVFLARVEGLNTVDVQTLCPDLYNLSVKELLERLEQLRDSGSFLLCSRGFTLPVLKTAYRRCKRKPFPPYYLTLDDLMESLDIPAQGAAKKLIETLPAPPASWPDDPPLTLSHCMEPFYQWFRTLLYQLEAEPSLP